MITRVAASLIVAMAIALITIGTWIKQKDRNEAQVARIAEAESYAARSQLIRNIETLLAALRNTRRYWAAYGHLPRDQWASDAGIELSHFDGVELILWDDPGRGNRYVRTADNGSFDYRPDEAEWQSYQTLVTRLRSVTRSEMAGPFVDDDGQVTYEIHVVDPHSKQGGKLSALVDASESLAPLLMNESPGYALKVLWDDVVLYRRGEAAPDAPESWTRSGLIETSMGALWDVRHAPTEEMQASFRSQAADTFLLLGLTIAGLVGTLMFENGRARSRAGAAESAEKKLAELNRNLEREISRRTETLANRTAVLETITDSVSHDLRNPLNSISMNAQLLEQQLGESIAAENASAFQRISRAIQQMIEILDRLLGLSAATHSTFDPVPIEMRKLIQEIFDELAASEPAPPVEFAVADLPDANGDSKLVRMLIMNLLGNALKYTRSKDSRRIDVDFERDDKVVTYRIRDNGIGFESRHAEDMFAAFHRLGNSKGTEGVGLGLAIAANVVSRHGGRISAEGAPGEGATFSFTLAPANAEGCSASDPA